MQATIPHASAKKKVTQLFAHEDFDIKNPNRVRSLPINQRFPGDVGVLSSPADNGVFPCLRTLSVNRRIRTFQMNNRPSIRDRFRRFHTAERWCTKR